MASITNIFGGEFVPPEPADTTRVDPPDVQMVDAIMAQGYNPPSSIIFDGQIHRFSASGKSKDDTGWYIAYDGKVHAGAFGCWREGTSINWREDMGREFSPMEEIEHANRMKEVRKKAELARQQKQETAAETSASIWNAASEASDDHPYLKTKGVKSHGLRITGDGRLIIPRYDSSGEIVSLQFIDATGEKKFKAGGQSSGAFFYVGHHDSQTTTVYLAEGYATAATIHEVTGQPCYVAFNAGNMSAVAETIRQHYQGDLCIVADHDLLNANTGRREGIHRAEEAAKQHRARVIYPPMEGMDANDYAQAGHDLSALLNPPADDWLVPADDFSARPSPIGWLIKGILQRESLIMVHGPSGGGKTFAVLDMCMSIAAGLDEWMGKRVKSGAVIYLAGEGHAGLRGRIAAWKQHNGVKRLQMWVSSSGTDLNTAEGLNKVFMSIDALPCSPVLILVDTLHRHLAGDENSSVDAKTMLDACAMIQNRYNSSVLLVHHTGVADEAQGRARGSSAWRGALENEFSVVPAKDDKPIEIVCRKMKDAELPEPMYAHLESVPIAGWFDDDGEQVTSAVLVADEAPPESVSKDADLLSAKKAFTQCWIETGREVDADGAPKVAKAALKNYLIERHQMKEKTAAQYLKESSGRWFGSLLEHGSLKQSVSSGSYLCAEGDYRVYLLTSKMDHGGGS